MKVIAFNGSPRADGNTSLLLDHVLEPIRAKGIQTDVYQLGGTNIHGCRACYACMRKKDGRCVNDDDVANECIAKMVEADGIILGSAMRLDAHMFVPVHRVWRGSFVDQLAQAA